MKLTVDQLHITLDRRPILREVNLEAAKGDIVGLVGPNGSGKSTLLRTVYRSLRPADGAVRVGGDDVWELSARTAARRTAAVLQDSGTTAGLTVTEIVALGRTPHHGLMGRDGAEDREAVAGAVARCGVTPSRTATTPPSPAANASASCLPGRWPNAPSSWFWTNSPTTSTSVPGSNSWT